MFVIKRTYNYLLTYLLTYTKIDTMKTTYQEVA